MKRKIKISILLFLYVAALLSGCKNSSSDYTLPPKKYNDNLSVPHLPTLFIMKTYEEYTEMLDTWYIPDNFIYYRDIDHLGEFVYYVPGSYSIWTPEEVHLRQEYGLMDQYGRDFAISFGRKSKEELKKLEERIQSYPELPECSFIYYTPEEGQLYYKSGDIEYRYLAVGRLDYVSWVYQNYVVVVDILSHDEYSEGQTDTLVDRLINTETSQDAMNELNRIIWKAEFSAAMKRILPIGLPVVCILGTGITVFVIRKRRKKKHVEKEDKEPEE